MSRLLALIAVTLCVTGVGCSRGPHMGHIAGEVTYDGKPLSHGTIIFEVSGAGIARGEIKEGQILEVTTIDPGDGVPVGEATVAINSVETMESTKSRNSETGGAQGMMMGRDLIPVRYSNPATSGLSAKIEAGDNFLKFELKK